MSRALSVRHSRVSPGERDSFRSRARGNDHHYRAAGCNYWVFEAADEPGACIEFFEASDAETLVRAHRAASDPALAAAPLYVQMELN